MSKLTPEQQIILDMLDTLDRDEFLEILEEAKAMFEEKNLKYTEWGQWE